MRGMMTTTDDALVNVLKERDALRSEVEALKRQLIMYRPHDARYRIPLYDLFMKVLHERNELQEQYARAIYTINTLRKNAPK